MYSLLQSPFVEPVGGLDGRLTLMSSMSDSRSIARWIDAMLEAAGLELTDEDRHQVLQTYSVLSPRIEALYEVQGAQHEVPGLVFIADPPLASWDEGAPR